MGCEPPVTQRGFDRAVAQAPGLVEPAEQQTGTTQRAVVPAALEDNSPRRLTLEELLAFLEQAERLTRLAKLRQHPGGGGDCGRKHENDVSRPEHRDPVLEPRARFRPVALEEMERGRSAVGLTH